MRAMAARDGLIVPDGETKVETDPDAIFAALRPYAERLRRVGHEAGSFSPWLQVELQQRGMPMVCLEAYHARSALSAMRNKTDRTDAQGIAHIVRTGWFKQVHVKSEDSYRLRLLLTYRCNLKRKFLDIENAIRHSIKTFGLKLGAVSRGQFEARVRELVEPGKIRWSPVSSIACCGRARRCGRSIFDCTSSSSLWRARTKSAGASWGYLASGRSGSGVQDFGRQSGPVPPLEDRRRLSRADGTTVAIGNVDRRFRPHLQGRRRRGSAPAL